MFSTELKIPHTPFFSLFDRTVFCAVIIPDDGDEDPDELILAGACRDRSLE